MEMLAVTVKQECESPHSLDRATVHPHVAIRRVFSLKIILFLIE